MTCSSKERKSARIKQTFSLSHFQDPEGNMLRNGIKYKVVLVFNSGKFAYRMVSQMHPKSAYRPSLLWTAYAVVFLPRKLLICKKETLLPSQGIELMEAPFVLFSRDQRGTFLPPIIKHMLEANLIRRKLLAVVLCSVLPCLS